MLNYSSFKGSSFHNPEVALVQGSAVHSRWDIAGLRFYTSASTRERNVWKLQDLCFSRNHFILLNTGTDEHSQCPIGELACGNVHLVTTVDKWEEKLSEANKDGKIIVVNFSASRCNPCRFIVPAYSELADKYPSMIFITVDVDQLAELSNSWEIKATPTIFFLKDGRQVDKLVGANKQELQKKALAIAESCSSSAAQ